MFPTIEMLFINTPHLLRFFSKNLPKSAKYPPSSLDLSVNTQATLIHRKLNRMINKKKAEKPFLK